MDTNTLREALRRQPFKPFTIRLSDGHEELVKHPEFVAVHPRVVVVVRDDTSSLQIEPMLITSGVLLTEAVILLVVIVKAEERTLQLDRKFRFARGGFGLAARQRQRGTGNSEHRMKADEDETTVGRWSRWVRHLVMASGTYSNNSGKNWPSSFWPFFTGGTPSSSGSSLAERVPSLTTLITTARRC